MADRYWVGGNGTWDNSTTTHWSDTSGGSGGFSVPTSADDVYFNSASSASAYAVTVPSTSVQNCKSINIAGPASGNVTFSQSGNPTINVYGSWTNASSGITWSINSATITFKSTSAGNTINTNGLAMQSIWAFDGVGGAWQLLSDFNVSTAGRGFTLTNGSLDLNGHTVTCDTIASNNSNVRSITFGGGKFVSVAGGGRILDFRTVTNLTITGTPVFESTYAGGTGTRTIEPGGLTGTSAFNIYVKSGTDIVTSTGNNWFGTLDFTGFSGSWSTNGTPRIYNNLVISSGMTITASAVALTFYAASGTQQITSNGKTVDFPITVGSGTSTNTLQLQDNLTCGSTRTFTHTSGTVDLNGKTLSTGFFASSNSNTRTIAFGTSTINVTGNSGNVWSTFTPTNLTVTGTPVVNATYNGSTGTRVCYMGDAGIANAITLNVTAGSDAVSLATSNSSYKNIDFTGFSGTASVISSIKIYGNLITSSGMTWGSGTSTMQFAATSGTQQVTTAGKTLDFPIYITAPGAIVQFQDALTQGSTRAFTMINGTLQLKAGVTSTVGAFATSGSNQKYLQSTVAGSQATLSQASGTVTVSYLSIKDIAATGGATWNSYVDYNNVDQGDNTGWDFSYSPAIDNEFPVTLRSFTQPKRF